MERIDLDGQVALVTGAGNGLGRAYALALAERGAAVVVNDLPPREPGAPSAAEAVVAEIAAAGGRAVAAHGSVASRADAQAAVELALERFGRLDAVVNNAGIVRPAHFREMTDEQLDLVLDVHVKGTFHVTQAAFGAMADAGYGRIVMIASNAGVFGMAAMANYAAAKAAILGLTRTLAIEGEPHGVKVNAVLPNATTTITAEHPIPGDSVQDGGTRAYKERLGDRFGPETVAPLIVYLASRACAVTGETYSALAGRFARVFTGTAHGWTAADARAVTPDDIAAHLDEIRDIAAFDLPESVRDEYRIVAERIAPGEPA